MAHITLIRPPGVSSRHAYTVQVVPPLGLAYIAAAVRAAGHDVSVIDALGDAPTRCVPSVHPKLVNWGLTAAEIVARVPAQTRAIGLSVMFSQQWPDCEALVRELGARFPGVPIAIGGEHATATWKYILETSPAVTACVLGEGEETIVDLARWCDGRRALQMIPGIACRVDGVPQKTAPRARVVAVNDIAPPAWDLFPVESYLSRGFGHGVDRGRAMPILATRGCPYQCTFCSSPAMWGTRYVMRDVARVADEIEDLQRRYRVENIDFEDLTAIIRREWILAFCAELERRSIRITWQLPSGTRSEALDREVLEALWKTGCRNVTYAPESGSPKTLGAIKKKLKPQRVLHSMREAHAVGIRVKANLMIGFPDERPHELFETLWFGAQASWNGADDVPLFPFSPYPGTELYDVLRAEARIPPLSNDYFASLGYMDLRDVATVSRHFSTRQIQLTRTVGMAVLYAIGYLRHPRRIVGTARNIARRRGETVLEQSLVAALRRASADRSHP